MNKKVMVFKINKGTHYSSVFLGIPHTLLPCFGDEMNFEVTFFETCKYSTVKPSNQSDANKLFGFTDGLTMAHSHSARFGWHYDLKTKKIVLHSYCYVNKIVKNVEIGSVDINVPVKLGIKRFKTEYVFTMNGNVVGRVAKLDRGNSFVNFKCFPYFGGDETAPHDILLKLK